MTNFVFIQECNVGEGETLLMFWGYEQASSDSKATISMSTDSCTSLHLPVRTLQTP